jgi:pimeloyl-ACP methyl ester carboxylesterase
MSAPTMIKARGDGVGIQLAVWEGKGKKVLCVHGLTANCRCWDLIASSLAPQHKIMAMDLRGRGLSDSPPSGYSVENHCRDILALLDDQRLERPVLMGHSLGAYISLVFAAKYPRRVDRLILIDGGGKLSDARLDKFFASIKPSLERLGKVFPDFESYLAPLKQAPFLKPWSSFFDIYFRHEVEKVNGGVRSRTRPEHIDEESENFGKLDASQFYSKVTVPTLILRSTQWLSAEDDLLLPQDVAERMVREIPNAKNVDVEGTNHYSIVFQPHKIRDQALLDFLK